MATKTPIDKLTENIRKVLNEYEDAVVKDVGQLAKDFAKKGAQALRGNPGGFGGTGTYSKGWTSRYEDGRVSKQGIIYNDKEPGLPHLLEHGHALRNGGRSKGVAHIAPVEDKISEEFYKAVKNSL